MQSNHRPASSQPILPLTNPKLGPGAVRCTRGLSGVSKPSDLDWGISVDINPPRHYNYHLDYRTASLECSCQERCMRESGKSQIDELNSRHPQCRGRVLDNVGEEGGLPEAGRSQSLKLLHLSFAQPSGRWSEQTPSQRKEKQRLGDHYARGWYPPSFTRGGGKD